MATTDSTIRQKQNALKLLDHTVDGLARRHRHRLYFRGLFDALFWGLGTAALVVFLLRLARQPHSVLLLTVLLIVVAVLISLFLTRRNLPDKLTIAIVADEKFQFKQRLSTAWEFRQAQPESALTSALALQAGGARLPSVSSVFPFALNLWGMLVPLAVCLLVLANLIELEAPVSPSVLTEVDKLVVEEGVRLEAFARRMRQRAEREGHARSLTESVDLQQLGTEMKSGALLRKQALQRLQRLQRSITARRSAALSAALGEKPAPDGESEAKYHTDRTSPVASNDALNEALNESGLSGFTTLRDKLSAGRLSPQDLDALNRSLESLDTATFSRDELKNALDRYSRGESGDLQQILDRLSETEKGIKDAEELDKARVAIMRSRENLGDESTGEQGALLEAEGMAFGEGGEMGDNSHYTLSEFPGDATGGGSGMSQDVASFLIPDNQADDAKAQSGETQVTLKPEAQIRQGDTFRSETWTMPRDGAPTEREVALDPQFEYQLEAVLSRETYPLHRKEFVRRYFLNLSQGGDKVSPTGTGALPAETKALPAETSKMTDESTIKKENGQ